MEAEGGSEGVVGSTSMMVERAGKVLWGLFGEGEVRESETEVRLRL